MFNLKLLTSVHKIDFNQLNVVDQLVVQQILVIAMYLRLAEFVVLN